MTTENFNGCKLALLQGDKLLVYKRDTKNNIPFPGMLDLPGGGRECEETPEQCVLRELYEEFFISLPRERLVYREKYNLSGPGEYAYFFVGELLKEEVEGIVLGEEGQHWEFMNIYEYLAHPDAIIHLQDRVRDYIDSKQDTYITKSGRTPVNTSEIHRYMRLAIEEGHKAVPQCGDNPPVGCVIVRGDAVVARGHTSPPGRPHAEAMALGQLETLSGGEVAFVTLEPCSFIGRTPSCAQALIDSGIKTVFVGIIDPDTRNNGRGISMLRDAGIDVHIGVLEKEISGELEGYLAKAL